MKINSKAKRFTVIIAAALICIIAVIVGLLIYSRIQIGKIPAMTFRETLEYATHDNPDAVITVGMIRGGYVSYTVYGENGIELEKQLHTYEIGSLTKTFTASLINRAVHEGKISLDDTIDKYLELPDDKNFPTISELLTHTSGYKGYYLESSMTENRIKGRNDFYGVTREMAVDRLKKLDMNKGEYAFSYSNYGYAVLGLVLEEVYDADYTSLLNGYTGELGLDNTHISRMDGDLGNMWDWQDNDAYIPAGAVTSDIEDMLKYAQMQLDRDCFSDCHKSLKTINASSQNYRTMGINMDEIGMAWIIDTENDIVWHNGGTGNYNSYLGFDKETGTAVVILSDLPPDYRIPATVMGVKLMNELRE